MTEVTWVQQVVSVAIVAVAIYGLCSLVASAVRAVTAHMEAGRNAQKALAERVYQQAFAANRRRVRLELRGWLRGDGESNV